MGGRQERGRYFPRFSLPVCLDIAKSIYREQGKPHPSRDSNIKSLRKHSPKAALLWASLVHFCIVEKSDGKFCFSTEILQYFDTHNSAILAVLFYKPAVFRDVCACLTRTTSAAARPVLLNDLKSYVIEVIGEGIRESTIDEVVTSFSESAQFAGVATFVENPFCLAGTGEITSSDENVSPLADRLKRRSENITGDGTAILEEQFRQPKGSLPNSLREPIGDNDSSLECIDNLLKTRKDRFSQVVKLAESMQHSDEVIVKALLNGSHSDDSNERSKQMKSNNTSITANGPVVYYQGENSAGHANFSGCSPNIQGDVNTVQTDLTGHDLSQLHAKMMGLAKLAASASSSREQMQKAIDATFWFEQHFADLTEPQEASEKVQVMKELGLEVWESFKAIVLGCAGSLGAYWLITLISSH